MTDCTVCGYKACGCPPEAHRPDIPFKSDGCSGGMSWFWRTFLRRDPPWEGACRDHDYAYWYGGSKDDRLQADICLAAHVTLAGYPLTAFIMYYAVRIGGMPSWRFSWCWNYGSKTKGYRQ